MTEYSAGRITRCGIAIPAIRKPNGDVIYVRDGTPRKALAGSKIADSFTFSIRETNLIRSLKEV